MFGFSAHSKGKHESKATKSTENELRERVHHTDYAKQLYLIKKYFLRKKKGVGITYLNYMWYHTGNKVETMKINRNNRR